MKTKKVVLGVDGSDGARDAMQWLIDFAAGIDVEVWAVHAMDVLPLYDPYLIPPDLEQWHERSYALLSGEWCEPLRAANMKFHAVVVEGAPSRVLREQARAHDADFIVVGARGRGKLAELLLGSVSHALVHHSTTPVLIVRPATS